jgi:hypothetical protein
MALQHGFLEPTLALDPCYLLLDTAFKYVQY